MLSRTINTTFWEPASPLELDLKGKKKIFLCNSRRWHINSAFVLGMTNESGLLQGIRTLPDPGQLPYPSPVVSSNFRNRNPEQLPYLTQGEAELHIAYNPVKFTANRNAGGNTVP